MLMLALTQCKLLHNYYPFVTLYVVP